jgi:hypothetical protein
MRSMAVGPMEVSTPPSALTGCHLPVPGRIGSESVIGQSVLQMKTSVWLGSFAAE